MLDAFGVSFAGVDGFAPSMLSRLSRLGCRCQSMFLSASNMRCSLTFFTASPSLCSWSRKRFMSSCSLPDLLRRAMRSVASQSGAL